MCIVLWITDFLHCNVYRNMFCILFSNESIETIDQRIIEIQKKRTVSTYKLIWGSAGNKIIPKGGSTVRLVSGAQLQILLSWFIRSETLKVETL